MATTDAGGRTLISKSLRLLPEVSGDFFHTIEEGDRLDHLAYKYYKQPRKWWRICDANPEFMSPLDMLGKEPVAIHRFPLSYNSHEGRLTWGELLRALYFIEKVSEESGLVKLSKRPGIEEVKVEEEVKLVPEKQLHNGEPLVIGGEPVIVYRECLERAVIITYNRMNISAEDLADIMTSSGFEVGKPERIVRVGKSLIIPPNIV